MLAPQLCTSFLGSKIVNKLLGRFHCLEETADISRRQNSVWFPRETTSEERAQKYYSDEASLSQGSASDCIKQIFNQSEALPRSG